jgi:DNA-binding IclR family transcriptional regulator
MSTSDRLLSILALFTIDQTEWTVEEAAAELDLAVSTAYRYFRSLSQAGLIVAFATGRYVLGPAIIQYDRQIRLRDPLTTSAQPVMKQLADSIPAHTVILLCRLFRNQVMCVHQESGEKPEFAVSYERGRAMPLMRGASSKIILAHMPGRTVKSLYADQSSKFAQADLGRTWDEVKERLRSLRSAGYAVSKGELDPGMCGIAAPVMEPEGLIVGSLSIVIPARHVTPSFLAQAPKLLNNAAERISWALSVGVHHSTAHTALPLANAVARTPHSATPRRRASRAAESSRRPTKALSNSPNK